MHVLFMHVVLRSLEFVFPLHLCFFSLFFPERIIPLHSLLPTKDQVEVCVMIHQCTCNISLVVPYSLG